MHFGLYSLHIMVWKGLPPLPICRIRKWYFCNKEGVLIVFYLTNRFHFAVRLYSDNAQMTSKCGENKEVRYEPQASSVTDVLTTF